MYLCLKICIDQGIFVFPFSFLAVLSLQETCSLKRFQTANMKFNFFVLFFVHLLFNFSKNSVIMITNVFSITI